MGLDIYAGTLTRYYSHNWKTVVQQWAEENGYTFNRITPDGEPADDEEELSPAEVQAAVENWRDPVSYTHLPHRLLGFPADGEQAPKAGALAGVSRNLSKPALLPPRGRTKAEWRKQLP